MEAENWRLCSTTLSGVSGELEDENWRCCSTTLVRGVSGELEDSSLAAALAPLQLSHVSRPPGSLERLTNFSYFAYS